MLMDREIPKGVSVVICTYNGAKRIGETLKCLAGQVTDGDFPWEVILVDNDSSDNTAAIATSTWTAEIPLNVVSERRRGITHARVKGVEQASYEYISFIDDDNWVSENWVREVYSIFSENPRVGACGGANSAVFDMPPPVWFEKVKGCYAVGKQGSFTEDVTETRGYLWGAGLSVRKSAWLNLLAAGFVFRSTGREGTKLSAGDDSELCLALKAAGYRLWYSDRLMLKHYMPAGRLTWPNAVGVMTGLGQSEFLLDIYRHAIRRSRLTILRTYGAIPGYALVYFGWRLATSFADHRNSSRYLSYIARKAYIMTALMEIGKVGKLNSEIRQFCLDAANMKGTV